MNSANPYFTGDEDDDLFESNTNSPNDDINIYGPNGEKLPKELAEALHKYIGNSDVSIKSMEIPLVCYAAADLISFFGELLSISSDAPVITALCDVVNRISNNMLDDFLELHQARHGIIMSHTIKNYSSTVFKAAEIAPQVMDGEKLKMYLGVYNSYLDWNLEDSIRIYLETCSKLGVEPEKELIDFGTISKEDKFTRIMYHPSSILCDMKELERKRMQDTEYGDDNFNE